MINSPNDNALVRRAEGGDFMGQVCSRKLDNPQWQRAWRLPNPERPERSSCSEKLNEEETTMADEKEKGTNQETNRPNEGKKKELSQEELDKVSGGHVALSGSNENPTES